MWCLAGRRKGGVSSSGRRSRGSGSGVRVVSAFRARLLVESRRSRGQCSSSSCGSFLNCTSVVVLMARQRRSPRKSLLAVGKWTFVRSFARMYATMSSERAGVAKWLWKISLVAETHLDALPYFTTFFAHMRLFARVNSSMNSQRRTLDELLFAARVIAHVRTDTSVDTFCTTLVRIW